MSQTSLAAAPRKPLAKADLAGIIASLQGTGTKVIADALGTNPKALRSALRRNGISLRVLRMEAKQEKQEKASETAGVDIRRPRGGQSARYGAAALLALPEHACRWPIGDPADPDFAFCGCKRLPGLSCCEHHQAKSRSKGGR